jgi:hypothetical protein
VDPFHPGGDEPLVLQFKAGFKRIMRGRLSPRPSAVRGGTAGR